MNWLKSRSFSASSTSSALQMATGRQRCAAGPLNPFFLHAQRSGPEVSKVYIQNNRVHIAAGFSVLYCRYAFTCLIVWRLASLASSLAVAVR